MRSLCVVLLAASLAKAAGPSSTDEERSKRHDQLVQTQADLKEMCDTVRGWKVAATGEVAADMDILSDPSTSSMDKHKAAEHLSEVDRDAAGLAPEQKQQFRANVEKTRESCTALEDEKSGLPALTADDAPLEKISKEDWDALADKLGALSLTFKGKNAFGDSASQSFSNCYGRGCESKRARRVAKVQLANDSQVQFATDFEGVVGRAIEGLKSSGGASRDGD